VPALLQGGPDPPWPAGAIHDSVAAIASNPAYNRSITESLWTAFWRWLGKTIDALLELFRGSTSGRWVTISLLVLLLLLIAARAYMAAKAARESAVRDVTSGRGGARAHPWLDAQRLAAAGNFTDAAHALLAALLAAIAAQGQVRLHSSKTAGDYSRELGRRGSPAHPRFESFRRRYDVAIYGRGEVSAAEYAGLMDDALPLIEGARAALEGARAA
jgi:hypothetical protein